MEITDIGKSSGEVYHYTSLAAALNIITSEGLKFHASRYDNMEDAYDSTYALGISDKILQKKGVDFLNMSNHNCRPYVISFCKKKDDFSMCRLYKAEVILHIDSDLLLEDAKNKSDLVMGNDVQYLSGDKLVDFVVNAYYHSFSIPGENEELDFIAQAKCSFLKHPDYSIEDEWRFSYFEDFDLTNWNNRESLKENELSSEMLCKTVNGTPRIYREIRFTKKCLKGITLIQHDFNELMKTQDTLATWLAQCGYENDEIEITKTKTPLTNK